jgi:hypothetical protein
MFFPQVDIFLGESPGNPAVAVCLSPRRIFALLSNKSMYAHNDQPDFGRAMR